MLTTLRSPYVAILLLMALQGAATAADAPGQRYLDAASQRDVSLFKKKVYEQLARVHDSGYPLAITGFTRYSLSLRPHVRTPANGPSDDAIDVLYRMGFNVLPILAEALDDATPSRMPIYDYGKQSMIGSGSLDTAMDEEVRRATRIGEWKVNQLVGALIDAIADREFVIVRDKKEYAIRAIGDKPELVPEFKKLVLDWYAENAKRTPLERKIADVQSNVARNRSSAIWWFGYNKEKAGRDAVAARMETILADSPTSSPHAGELAEGALTLGQLGDVASIDVVRRICRTLAHHVKVSNGMDDYLFTACEGLALLGEKDDAISELDQFRAHNLTRWDSYFDEMYQRRIADARKKW